MSIFTSEMIQDDRAIRPLLDSVFDNVFSAKKLGVTKTTKEAYIKIAELLKLAPENILYIDDNQNNISAAQAAGLHAVRYESNAQIISAIKSAILL